MSRNSRESETRAHEKRINYSMEYVNSLSLPPGVAKDGKAYHWARITVRGSDDFSLEDSLNEGWELVPAERAHSYTNLDPLNRNPFGNKYIVKKDVILIEIDAPIVEERTRRLHKLNNDQVKSLRGVTNDPFHTNRLEKSISSF